MKTIYPNTQTTINEWFKDLVKKANERLNVTKHEKSSPSWDLNSYTPLKK